MDRSQRYGFRASTSTSSLDDYKRGRHSAWERVLHEFEARFRATGTPIPIGQRNFVVDCWIANHSPEAAEEVVDCPPCQEQIAEALLNHRDPHSCPPGVREQLHQFGLKQGFKRRTFLKGD